MALNFQYNRSHRCCSAMATPARQFEALGRRRPHVRIVSGAALRNKTGVSKTAACARSITDENLPISTLLGREHLAEPLPLLAGEAHELQLLDRPMVTLAGIDLDAGQ